MRALVLFAAACLAVTSFPVVTFAEDWPQYRGATGDGKTAIELPPVTWTGQGPNLLWKVPTPLGFSSFAIADGRAMTLVSRDAADGKLTEFLIALDANTGKEVWNAPLGVSDYGHDGGNSGAEDNRGGDGPRSTPAIDGNRVYVYDSHLVLSCFEAESGKLVWRHDIVSKFDGRNIKWLNASSPIVTGDSVIVGGGGAGQSFLAFNKTSGDVVWKSGNETITHATPTLATINHTEQIIFFVESGLVAVNATTGQELWQSKFPFSVSTAASPIADKDRVYCSAGYGVGAGLFQIATGNEPKELWFKPNELMNHWSTPIVHDGHLYGIYEFKKYGKAPLQCVDLSTGEIKWSERGFGPGNCILVNDKLIVLSDAGEVAIVEAVPSAYREVAKAKILGGKCWSTPAYSDNRIYVRSTTEAACIVLD